jgi:hypothetical protein
LTTKEWLSRATNIDKEIGRLLRERRAAWDRAVSVTSRLNANCVSGTKDPHKYDALVAYENLIDQKVDELYAVKQEILSAIWGVSDAVLREVLQRKYIEFQSLEQIAVGMNYSYRQVRRLHGKALAQIERCPTMSSKLGL